jgi:hypothetical protein
VPRTFLTCKFLLLDASITIVEATSVFLTGLVIFCNRQRPGGKPDDSDLKKKSPFGSMFSFGKKNDDEPAAEESKTNWWTLS